MSTTDLGEGIDALDLARWRTLGYRIGYRNPQLPEAVRRVVVCVAMDHGCTPSELLRKRKLARLFEAKCDLTHRLRHMVWGRGHPSLPRIALWLGIDHTSVLRRLRRFAEMRAKKGPGL